MSLRVLCTSLLALCVVSLLDSTAVAQPRRPQVQMQPIKSGGTLVMVGPNQLQLSTNTNQPILVMFGPDTHVSVTGAAEQDYLKAGVNVEFVADLDKTHAATAKIFELTIVSLTNDHPASLSTEDSAAADKKSEKSEKGEKVKDNPLPDAANPPLAKPRKGRGGKDADPQGGDLLSTKPSKASGGAPKFPCTCRVRGTIKMYKDGKMTVAAGRGPTVKAELSSDCKIDVDMADLHAAQRDDRVTVEGLTTQQRPNVILAKTITVSLANPLSGAKKHSTRPGKASATPAAKASTAAPAKSTKGGKDPDDLLGGGK